MAWVKLDDQAPRHAKMLKAGPAACWLWVCGIAHAQSQLTDGFISLDVLSMIGVKGASRCRRLAEVLVDAGLFEHGLGGYVVHGYLDHNPSRASVLVKRSEDLARKKAGEDRRHQDDRRAIPAGIRTESSQIPELPAAASHPIPSLPKKEKKDTPPKEPADPSVRVFLEWFTKEYKTRLSGADYLVKWGKHSTLVKPMLKTVSLDRLQQFAQIMLSEKCDEPFIVGSDRGIEILSAKFSWLSSRLAAWEAKQQVSA